MTEQPIISLQDIHKSFGSLEVLKGVNLSAKRGDVVALIGSSGSGKSTLLRCANMLEICQQGDIVFDGDTVRWKGAGLNRKPADEKQVIGIRSRLSMVFQQFNLWSHMSILENVVEAPISVLGKDKVEAEELGRALLEKVGIADKCDFYPAQLSGGQQQRAAIARALAMQPVAMLFDEPTSALDPELEAEVVKVIKALAAEGNTMIIVTHDMKLARELSDHVVFLHQGRIEEEGAPEEVFGNPKSERLRQFLSATTAQH